jgi:hypothetical protein
MNDSNFMIHIVLTIETQLNQITLMQRAKDIYRKKPTFDDYNFINEKSDRLMVAFKLPVFVKSYINFLEVFRRNLIGTLIRYTNSNI